MPDPNGLAQATRRLILKVVQADPGTHPTAVARLLDRSVQLVCYHADILESDGHVRSVRHGRRRHLLPADGDGVAWPRLLERYPAKQRVLEVVADASDPTVSEVADTLDVAPSTVSRHVDALETWGVLTSDRTGEGRRLHIVPRSKPADEEP